MLFNLTCCRHFPSKQTGKEILCWEERGPYFTGADGTSELGACYEPFNGEHKCFSRANCPGFGIPNDGTGNNLLTNKKDGSFTITELEVWEVTYID
jgi:hypothetical protein